MAFDHPLDADSVDNLGLLSSFVRAPIVGSIMWMLGGLLEDKENKQNKNSRKHEPEGSSSTPPTKLQEEDDESEEHTMNREQDHLEDTATDTYTADASSIPLRRSDHNLLHSLSLTRIASSESATANEDTTMNPSLAIRKKSRKMSWSDESGQKLAQYWDEVSCIHIASYPCSFVMF